MVELITPGSVLTVIEKLRLASFHLYHEKLKGPVPEGLTAVRVPLTSPEALQKTKTGSLLPGLEG